MDEFIIATLRYGTPLVYVTLAGVLAQRAGIWNLGLEGLMIVGCCASVLGLVQTGSLLFGLGLAIVLCVLGSILLWFVVEKLRANPIIAGLGLTGLGLGGTDLAVQAIYGSQASVNALEGLPRLGAIFGPAVGPYGVLSVLVVLMPFVVIGLWILLRRTRFGLQLAAAGEHPFAARSVGVNPSRMRFVALAMGGVLCALGGAELALGSLQIFAYGMTAGRGFMGFSAVIFGGGHPIGSTFAALFFSVVGAIGIRAQLMFGDKVPHDLLLALPYIATVIGVWISGRLRGGARAAAVSGELRDY
jgi:simple sugar transport system permease protein